MPVYRFLRRVSRGNAYPIGPFCVDQGYIEKGEVCFGEKPCGTSEVTHPTLAYEELPAPWDKPLPTNFTEVGPACDDLLDWHDAGYANERDTTQIMRHHLCSLVECTAKLRDAPSVPFGVETVKSARTLSDLVTLTKQLKERGPPAEVPPRPDAKGETPKRTGRRRKSEQGDGPKIVAALAVHHQYEQGGGIGNWEPSKGKALAQAAGVGRMAVTRFMQKCFREGGHKGYEAACRQEKIGLLLAQWQGDVSEGHSDLWDSESGRRRED